jgi:kynurenine formamidase
MSSEFFFKGFEVEIDTPIDISIPITNASKQLNAFYIPSATMAPLQAGSFVGSIAAGGSANCFNIQFNPHGNGTHTECVGHIAPEHYSVNEVVKNAMMLARLISVEASEVEGDQVILLKTIQNKVQQFSKQIGEEAIIVRLLPNSTDKLYTQYSGKNPPYFEAAVLAWLADLGYKHFITDLPSVDREEDAGKLLAHHAWWKFPHATRMDATITELVFIADEWVDDLYFLNLQVAPFICDASPSRPVLYRLLK